MSASTPKTGLVRRAKRRSDQSGEARPAGGLLPDAAQPPPTPALVAPPTPVPPSELLAHAGEVRALLGELAELTGSENAWGLRVVRRNVELALSNPETLDRAENQMDFIEELTEAVWDGTDSGFRYSAKPAVTPEATRVREERREAVVARLDQLTDQLCKRVEDWQAIEATAAGASADQPPLPQSEHMV